MKYAQYYSGKYNENLLAFNVLFVILALEIKAGKGCRKMKRRDFFTKGFPAYVFKMGEAFVETAGLTEEEKKGYFDSFESCYPLLSEVSNDMMLQAADQLGIQTQGKDKITLAREIYAIKGGLGF